MLLHFSHGTGNYGLTSCPNSGSLGGSAAEFDRFDGESGSLAMRSVQYRRVLPQSQCSIERIPPRRLARPISQACTRRLCSRGFGARPLASPSHSLLENSRAAEPSRASSRDSRVRKIKKISYAVQSARTDRRIEKFSVLRNCTDCPMYYGATRATRFAILIPELPRVRLCAMSG